MDIVYCGFVAVLLLFSIGGSGLAAVGVVTFVEGWKMRNNEKVIAGICGIIAPSFLAIPAFYLLKDETDVVVKLLGFILWVLDRLLP